MFCQGFSVNIEAMSKKTTQRRVPLQARSQERVGRILDAASELVERDGSNDLKMSEVAPRAGVPTGSVYQYFPNKSAIIRALAERFHGRVRQVVNEELVEAVDRATSIAALERVLDRYYELCLDEPVFHDIWWGAQADKALQETEIADSRTNARLIYEALEPLMSDQELSQLESACFLLSHLAGAAVGLAISIGRKEGDDLLAEYKSLVRLRVTDLTEEQTTSQPGRNRVLRADH